MLGGRTLAVVQADFPILSRRIGEAGAPLSYLDNAATTQKPRAVIDALGGYYTRSNANVHRALHTLGEEATALYEESRELLRGFLGARSVREIVFTRGTTESINLVARAWGSSALQAGDEIILSEVEHHSNLVPWQMIAAERGAALRFLRLGEDGALRLEELERLWSPCTRLVAVTHVSNVLGAITELRRISAFARERGVPVLVDAAQSAAHLPLNVQELGCDFLALSGHKMYGPMGIGVLYGREELLEAMPPFQGGGEMIRAVWPDRATWNELPFKFEAGTPNVEGALGLAAAVAYLDSLGAEAVRSHEDRLTRYALARLRELAGVQLYGGELPPAARTGVISFNLQGIHPHDVAQFLDARGVAVRAGHHCAQPLMRRLGVAATVRASLALYNSEADIDRLLDALAGARRYFL
jgi:cysteine desulfurase/selenocysteine lyase